MNLPTWGDLRAYYCTAPTVEHAPRQLSSNPCFEDVALRRYNYAASEDKNACRLVFLKGVLSDPTNKTLRRKGRFIWCKNLEYLGKDEEGYRNIRFTVDKGQKRFTVSERDMLCLPSKIWVNNNRYFRSSQKIFTPFSSVFSYPNTIKMLAQNHVLSAADLLRCMEEDSPFSPGTLVAPRLGYFYPEGSNDKQLDLARRDQQHPCGIILGRSFAGDSDYANRELYRVRFANTTYEKIHPVQLEILNEV